MKLYKIIKDGKTYIVVKHENGKVRVFKVKAHSGNDEPDQCPLRSRPHSRGVLQLERA